MPSTTGMKGGGFYDAHSSPQRLALEPYVGWLEAAIPAMELPLDTAEPVRLLDIGSSEGANAIFAQKRLVDALRRRTTQPIKPILSDLPTSDYNRLVANIFPLTGSAFSQPEVYPSVIAGSGYEQLMPHGSAHAVTTFNMLGWLSRRPSGRLPSYVAAVDPSPYAVGVDYAVSAEEMAAVHQQAAQDMAAFYQARAAEIPSGGLLLLQVFGSGKEHSTGHGICDAFHDTLSQLVAEGVVPAGVQREFFLPVVYRTLDALLAPLIEDPALATCFEVERAETLESPVPFNQAFEENGDAAAWAKEYAGFIRAFSEPILEAAVVGQGASRDLIGIVYARLERRLREEPPRYRFHFISVGALLRRA